MLSSSRNSLESLELPLTSRLLAIVSSLTFILVVALGTRAGFAWSQERKIPHEVLATVPFAQETGSVALALSQGQGFSSPFRNNTGPTAWLVPVYPLLLSVIFRIFGPMNLQSFAAIVGLNIVFSTLTCIPIFHIGRRLGGRAVATLATWLWVLLPNAIMIPFEWIWDTSLSAFLVALLLYFTFMVAASRKLRDWLAYGALWGFSLLTNASIGALLLPWIGWAFYRQSQITIAPETSATGNPSCAASTANPHPFRNFSTWRGPLLSLTLALLCCLPWTVRNYVQFHKLIPLRSNFPFEFWSGNNSIFDPYGGSPMARITQAAEVRQYKQLGEAAYMADKWRRAKEFFRTHPRLEVQLTRDRIITTWFCTKTPVADFLETDSWLIRIIFLYNAMLFIGSVVGIFVLARRRNILAFPLAAAPLFFPLVYCISHVSLRLRHPLDPVLVILTAVSIAALSPICRAKFSGSAPRKTS
jgi:Dolichyl-phosphate-mannose-protein mannosyltransferase